MSLLPPPSPNRLTLRLGRHLEARASGWGLAVLVVLALIAAGLGLVAPRLLDPGVGQALLSLLGK